LDDLILAGQAVDHGGLAQVDVFSAIPGPWMDEADRRR